MEAKSHLFKLARDGRITDVVPSTNHPQHPIYPAGTTQKRELLIALVLMLPLLRINRRALEPQEV
jgi:hypothetical protein